MAQGDPKFKSSDFPPTATGCAADTIQLTPTDPPDANTQSANCVKSKGVLCSVDMTLKVRTAAGNDRASVPFQKGYNPIQIQEVWSTGSTLNGGVLFGLIG